MLSNINKNILYLYTFQYPNWVLQNTFTINATTSNTYTSVASNGWNGGVVNQGYPTMICTPNYNTVIISSSGSLAGQGVVLSYN